MKPLTKPLRRTQAERTEEMRTVQQFMRRQIRVNAIAWAVVNRSP